MKNTLLTIFILWLTTTIYGQEPPASSKESHVKAISKDLLDSLNLLDNSKIESFISSHKGEHELINQKLDSISSAQEEYTLDKSFASDNWPLAQVIVTIIGWCVAAYWAIAQVKIAHKKNAELHQALIKRDEENNLYREFLDIHLNLMKSLNDTIESINHVSTNMIIAKEWKHNEVQIGWVDLIDKIDQNYSILFKNINHLEIWLDSSKEFLTNASEIYSSLEFFNKDFISLRGDKVKETTSGEHLSVWGNFQTVLFALKVNRWPNYDQFEEPSERVINSLLQIKAKFNEHAKNVRKSLLYQDSLNA